MLFRSHIIFPDTSYTYKHVARSSIRYLSKTVLYALFGEDTVMVIDQVFKNTLGSQYSVHKHQKDIGWKIAPHVCKCTTYQGKLYDMGIGQISYEEN